MLIQNHTFFHTESAVEITSSTTSEGEKRTDSTSTTQHQTTGTTRAETETTRTSHNTTPLTTSGSRSTTGSTTTTTSGTTSYTTTTHVQTTSVEHEPTDYETAAIPEVERTSTTEYQQPNPAEPENEIPNVYSRTPPPSPPYNPNHRPKNRGGRISSIEEERTAMIIGIVAGVLIAVILVILLVLWLKSTGERSYKAEPDKGAGYGQGPNAALLGNTGTNSSYHHSRHQISNGSGANSGSMSGMAGYGASLNMNGSMMNGSDKCQPAGLVQPKPKKRDSKDIKEWYV